jgi:GH24 family phage-related lysozyme (muramidase)
MRMLSPIRIVAAALLVCVPTTALMAQNAPNAGPPVLIPAPTVPPPAAPPPTAATPAPLATATAPTDMAPPPLATALPPTAAAPGRDLSAFVKHWETFQPHSFQDSIGYGTRPHPGETSISEREAARRLDDELAQDRAKIEQLNPQLPEGAKKALTSLLYNLGGDVNKLKEHGMANAIASGDVGAMKKAHVEFSHTHGPHGKVDPGLRDRRIDELGFYNEADSPAANSVAPIQVPAQQYPVQQNAISAGPSRDLSAFVKHWETFQPHPFQDIGGDNIGYGTRAHPGETSISEREAARRMDDELARDRAKIEQLNPQLPEGAKKALTSLLYNLGGEVNKLKEHGMANAIASGEVEAMKKAHVEFSHIHGPQGPVEPGLRDRRIDELGFYNEGDSLAANSMSYSSHRTNPKK